MTPPQLDFLPAGLEIRLDDNAFWRELRELLDPRRVRECAAIGIDGKADALDLKQTLLDNRVPKLLPMVAGPSDAVSASGMFVNAVRNGEITHLEDQALGSSVIETTRRKIGDGFGFDGTNTQRIDSCALALWALRTTKRNPLRKGRVGC
jgi:hypothetical protein